MIHLFLKKTFLRTYIRARTQETIFKIYLYQVYLYCLLRSHLLSWTVDSRTVLF